MIPVLLLLLFIMGITPVYAQQNENPALIPKPLHQKAQAGIFTWNRQTIIVADKGMEAVAQMLSEQSGTPVSTKQSVEKATRIHIQKKPEPGNGYRMSILPAKIIITAATEKNALAGIFTLLQLRMLQADPEKIPCSEILDQPRFSYRGMHLDVSRHFFPVPFLEKMLDMMAIYKLNTFHWHLTDGPGWRLQIRKYPELTRRAAWRTHAGWKEWWNSGRKYSIEGAPGAYGGYYTQEQVKGLVQYAAKRGITIIPEIEMPGHSEEVLAVMPQLACSGKPYTQGELCIGNDSSFVFLEDVLKEVMDLFPSTYIHIGGDEAGKEAWKTCMKCQQRKSKEGLKDEHELQSYAIGRMDKFLSSHGRKLIGWDEILEGGLSKGATVMSWRGESGGIAAARVGQDVIMTPGSHCYFDSYQSDPTTQPEAIGGYLPLSKVYAYDPVPRELTTEEQKHILGVQANLWTEYIPTMEHAEYMLFPRLLALAEVAWSEPAAKDWNDFHRRLQDHYLLLQRNNIGYYRPRKEPIIQAVADTLSATSMVSISSETYAPAIYYTTDNTLPTVQSMRYTGPFRIPGIKKIKASIADSTTGTMGPVAEMFTTYHQGVGSTVHYNQPYSKSYPAQAAYTLVNGQTGSFSYGDGQWQGFEGRDMDVTIELKETKTVDSISVRFMQLTGPGVYMPARVEFSWSVNGKDYSAPVTVMNQVPEDQASLITEHYSVSVQDRAKYIRIRAQNHKRGFLFADEVIIR